MPGPQHVKVQPAVRRITWSSLVVLASVAAVPSCADSTPETPGNAVMDYLTAAQVGKDSAAEERLCESLRAGERPEDMEVVLRVTHEASLFGEGVLDQDDQTAVVALEVLFAPSPRGAVGDPWVAEMVMEDGRWKLCGLAPRDPEQ